MLSINIFLNIFLVFLKHVLVHILPYFYKSGINPIPDDNFKPARYAIRPAVSKPKRFVLLSDYSGGRIILGYSTRRALTFSKKIWSIKMIFLNKNTTKTLFDKTLRVAGKFWKNRSKCLLLGIFWKILTKNAFFRRMLSLKVSLYLESKVPLENFRVGRPKMDVIKSYQRTDPLVGKGSDRRPPPPP